MKKKNIRNLLLWTLGLSLLCAILTLFIVPFRLTNMIWTYSLIGLIYSINVLDDKFKEVH